MNRLKEKFVKTIAPALQKQFGYASALQTPRIEKVVVNVGTGQPNDPKLLETAEETLIKITGQKPLRTQARKSISNFKIREGNVVGVRVTLRGKRMYDFLDKLISVSFPRVRDFQGVNRSGVDQFGNLSIGFTEHMAFPEIKADELEKIHGLEVTIVTSAKNREEGTALFEQLGIPFQK